MRMLLGDIGGTKTRLRLCEVREDGQCCIISQSTFKSADYADLVTLITSFIDLSKPELDAAVLGVAGPVTGNLCKTTNLPWEIDACAISRQLHIEVVLLNDFYTLALGIPHLRADDFEILQPGEFHKNAPLAVIGAGTGLGEALIVPMKNEGHLILSSEGGHADFAPRNPLEIDLLKFLQARYSHVSVERVVSGPGLQNIYDFVLHRGLAEENPMIRAALVSGNPGEVIGENGLSHKDAACAQALQLFVSIYGAEAGNLALKVLPRGGVYLAGGIAPKIVQKLRGRLFLDGFNQKGRMSQVLKSIRVSVVMNAEVSLLGAQVYGRKLIQNGTKRFRDSD